MSSCGGCEKIATNFCACGKIRYCSRDCQRKNWPQHKPNCSAKKVDIKEQMRKFHSNIIGNICIMAHHNKTNQILVESTEKITDLSGMSFVTLRALQGRNDQSADECSIDYIFDDHKEKVVLQLPPMKKNYPNPGSEWTVLVEY